MAVAANAVDDDHDVVVILVVVVVVSRPDLTLTRGRRCTDALYCTSRDYHKNHYATIADSVYLRK